MTWDDENNRNFGLCTFQYVFSTSSNLDCIQREHGVIHSPFFELVLIGIEKGFHLTDTRTIYFARHLATFLLFYLGLIVFYRMTRFFLREWAHRMLACVLMILTPRIFSDAFYNSVDIGALVFFVFEFYSMLRFFEEPSKLRAVWHAFICAMAIDTRVTSVLVAAMTFAGFLPLLFPRQKDQPKGNRPTAPQFIVYGFSLGVFVIMFWPLLWKHPFSNILIALNNTANFHSEYLEMQYLGRLIRHSPWHYNFVWMLVTIPISYTIFFFFGISQCVQRLVRNPQSAINRNAHHLALIVWFGLPLAGAVILKTDLYNAWRHHFFIYPAFLVLAVIGFRDACDYARSKRNWLRPSLLFLIGVLVLADLGGVVSFMIRNHPYEHVYFNRIAGGVQGAKRKFEMDYWVLSSRKILEYITATDPSPIILIAANYPEFVLYNNALILPSAARERLRFVDKEEATYFIVLFNDLIINIPVEFRQPPTYSVRVDGVQLAAVYKRMS